MTQSTPAETTLGYSKITERYAHFFDRPEVRLRFLHNTLAKQAANRERLDHTLRRFDFIKNHQLYQKLLELWFYDLLFKELKQLLPDASRERRRLLRRSKAPFSARLFFFCYQARHALYVFGIAALLAAPFGVYNGAVWSRHRISAYLAQRYQTKVRTGVEVNGQNTSTPADTSYLPDYRPEKVWLVERKENYERYSNGGRILTDYETDNHERGYYVLARNDASSDASPAASETNARHEPVGIIYHTSESDLLPFNSDNNESIETHTRGLLEYVQRHRSYNYVIDRFGQIYRIVRDEQAANHAGNSVWADERGVYVGLNESFLGVCFETKTEVGAQGEQLTEAQLIAGRLLTQILRSHYNIDDADCVTHGLVSVNPDNMLICYHHDWARNFPFEAFGLSDKYKVAPVSISEYGFTYDGEIESLLGGHVWPGAEAAEEEFKRRAERVNLKPEQLRRQMRERYRQQMELARKARAVSTDEAETSRNETQFRLSVYEERAMDDALRVMSPSQL